MEASQLAWITNFIWGIADDVLRDLYVRGKYRDVILPMTVLRRLDAVLEPTKQDVLRLKAQLDAAGIANQDEAMEQVKERSRERGFGGFWKLPAFVAGPEDITYPAKTNYLDYEGEIAVVIGRRVKDARESDLESCIWGYTLQNDGSARDQRDNVVGTLSMNLMKKLGRLAVGRSGDFSRRDHGPSGRVLPDSGQWRTAPERQHA